MICRLLGHKFRLFKAYRLRPSVIHQIRCRRCGQVQVLRRCRGM